MKYTFRKPGSLWAKIFGKYSVRIDPWDTWSVDIALTPAILALLKQFESNVGKYSVPMEMTVDEWRTRILEMTEAFQSIYDEEFDPEYEYQFYADPEAVREADAKNEFLFEVDNSGYVTFSKKLAFRDDYQEISDGIERKRQNGLFKFAQYFRNLWE